MLGLWTLGLCWGLWGAVAAEPIRPDGPGDVPPAAADEIRRRGALVEHVGGIQAGDEAVVAFTEAVAPPTDDGHKWFFTLVVTRGCPWCEKMRSDFAHSPYLKAWVNVKEPKDSWAHWQVVQIEDQSQAWRWKNVRPTRFPTLIVQPPLNRSFGDPATVVFMRQGYLEPEKLDAEIRAAIRDYTKKVAPQYRAWKVQREQALAGEAIGQADATGQTADWRPPAPPPSPLPEPSVPFQVPPPAVPSPSADNLGLLLVNLLGKLMPSFQTILLLLLALSNVWMLYRDLARQTGVKMLIDDQTAQQIVNVIRKVAGGSGGPPPPSPPAA
jgi:hypothetical protein